MGIWMYQSQYCLKELHITFTQSSRDVTQGWTCLQKFSDVFWESTAGGANSVIVLHWELTCVKSMGWSSSHCFSGEITARKERLQNSRVPESILSAQYPLFIHLSFPTRYSVPLCLWSPIPCFPLPASFSLCWVDTFARALVIEWQSWPTASSLPTNIPEAN
jgi:hypothetical protein